MRVLIIKMSSMGDIIHTLPALTDAGVAIPGIQFDWVVEESFADIATWHPLVNRVIPIALRRWRKHLFTYKTWREWRLFRKNLRATEYDIVLDAQSLLKSALIGLQARGKKRIGLDSSSARESLAALFYQQTIPVKKKQHAITRLRQLFATALGYAMPETIPNYGLDRASIAGNRSSDKKYFIFLHATTWVTKQWPEAYWIALTQLATAEGYEVKLPWGNEREKESAERIAAVSTDAHVLPRQTLQGMAVMIAGAEAVVAVDTGLLHLTAALGVPAVSLYGPTNPLLSGSLGDSQQHLSADFPCSPCLSRECRYQGANLSSVFPPCFETIPPEKVWQALRKLICL